MAPAPTQRQSNQTQPTKKEPLIRRQTAVNQHSHDRLSRALQMPAILASGIAPRPANGARLGLYRSVTRLQTSLNCVVDLPPMDRHLTWRLNAKSYLVSADLHHNDFDVVVDDDTFVLLS